MQPPGISWRDSCDRHLNNFIGFTALFGVGLIGVAKALCNPWWPVSSGQFFPRCDMQRLIANVPLDTLLISLDVQGAPDCHLKGSSILDYLDRCHVDLETHLESSAGSGGQRARKDSFPVRWGQVGNVTSASSPSKTLRQPDIPQVRGHWRRCYHRELGQTGQRGGRSLKSFVITRCPSNWIENFIGEWGGQH